MSASASQIVHEYSKWNDERVRTNACLALLEIGDDRAIERLRELAQVRNELSPEVRRQALEALAALANRHAEALVALEESLAGEPDPSLRRFAMASLVKMEDPDSRIIGSVAAALRNDPDAETRRQGVEVLRRFARRLDQPHRRGGESAAMLALARAATMDADPKIRGTAGTILKETIGGAELSLERDLKDEDYVLLGQALREGLPIPRIAGSWGDRFRFARAARKAVAGQLPKGSAWSVRYPGFIMAGIAPIMLLFVLTALVPGVSLDLSLYYFACAAVPAVVLSYCAPFVLRPAGGPPDRITNAVREMGTVALAAIPFGAALAPFLTMCAQGAGFKPPELNPLLLGFYGGSSAFVAGIIRAATLLVHALFRRPGARLWMGSTLGLIAGTGALVLSLLVAGSRHSSWEEMAFVFPLVFPACAALAVVCARTDALLPDVRVASAKGALSALLGLLILPGLLAIGAALWGRKMGLVSRVDLRNQYDSEAHTSRVLLKNDVLFTLDFPQEVKIVAVPTKAEVVKNATGDIDFFVSDSSGKDVPSRRNDESDDTDRTNPIRAGVRAPEYVGYLAKGDYFLRVVSSSGSVIGDEDTRTGKATSRSPARRNSISPRTASTLLSASFLQGIGRRPEAILKSLTAEVRIEPNGRKVTKPELKAAMAFREKYMKAVARLAEPKQEVQNARGNPPSPQRYAFIGSRPELELSDRERAIRALLQGQPAYGRGRISELQSSHPFAEGTLVRLASDETTGSKQQEWTLVCGSSAGGQRRAVISDEMLLEQRDFPTRTELEEASAYRRVYAAELAVEVSSPLCAEQLKAVDKAELPDLLKKTEQWRHQTGDGSFDGQYFLYGGTTEMRPGTLLRGRGKPRGDRFIFEILAGDAPPSASSPFVPLPPDDVIRLGESWNAAWIDLAKGVQDRSKSYAADESWMKVDRLEGTKPPPEVALKAQTLRQFASADQVIAEAGRWITQFHVKEEDPEPPIFREFFIVVRRGGIQDGAIGIGSIVTGDTWENDDQPRFEIVYGWGRTAGKFDYYADSDDLTHLGRDPGDLDGWVDLAKQLHRQDPGRAVTREFLDRRSLVRSRYATSSRR